MGDITVRGTPQLVDSFMRPVARILAGLFGGLFSVALGWFAGLWWAPVPLAVALLSTEWVFFRRGDRVQTIRVSGTTLTLADPLAPAPLVIDLASITVATSFSRAAALGEHEVVVSLGDDQDVRFAVRILQRTPPHHDPHRVNAEAMDLLFGGVAGLYRALAPADRRPRQTFHDHEGRLLVALHEALPTEAWARTGLRLWPGMEPEIDLFGYYRAVHSDWLVLDGHSWRRDGEEGRLDGWTLASSEREAILFQGLDKQQVQRLPLALINLSSHTTIATPSPAAPDLGQTCPLSSDLLHTHAPEGAALLWHLLTHTPRDRWPPILAEMIHERRAFREDLDAVLPG